MFLRPSVAGHCRVCRGCSHKDGLALKSGRNRYNHGFDICNPGRPFFFTFADAGNRNEFFNL